MPIQKAIRHISPAPSTTPQFEQTLQQKFQFISRLALKQGMHIMGGSGSGKSRALGRVFAKYALEENQPLVVIDPTGGVVDNILDTILRLPLKQQKKLWRRLLYIDAGATDYCVPSPLYYRLSKSETLFESANRFPSIEKKIDIDLQSAPILGWNSLYECAIHAGKIAVASGKQLDFIADLVNQPGKYKGLLREVLVEHPTLLPDVSYFREMMDPNSSALREKRTGSFKNKLLPFLSDPSMLATFAAPVQKLNWKKLIRERKAVLIDLRHELDPDRRQFKMIWYLNTFTGYIKFRGMAGRGQEIMLIVDEITQMLGHRTKDGNSILSEDFEELISVLARNFGVNVVLAHQNLSQIDERLQNILMQMGTQMIGVLTNPDDAIKVARYFTFYDPHWIRKTERVWHSIREPLLLQMILGHYGPVPQVIDYTTTEYTPEEQVILAADKLRTLGRFRFYAKVAKAEGDLRGAVKLISIARVDAGQYPNEAILAPLRRQLTLRDGIPVKTILAQMRQRHQESLQKQVSATKQAAILKNKLPNNNVPADHLSTTAAATDLVSSTLIGSGDTYGSDDEPVFQ